MSPEEIKVVLDLHYKWLKEETDGKKADLYRANLYRADLYRADLSGADLSGANLSGANLSGAKINWQSHQLVSEILLRAANDDVDKRMVAGLIRISTDWCWDKIMSIEHPQKEWALEELKKWVWEEDNAPDVLKTNTKTAQEKTNGCSEVNID